MMDLKRYDIWAGSYGTFHQDEHPAGEWVRYSDIAPLLQRIEEAENNAYQRVADMLKERAAWLRKEYLAGGNYEYLAAKEQDCTYMATKILALKHPITTLSTDEQGVKG